MKIVFDNIIYSLQKSGGISVYWNNLENGLSINKALVYPEAKTNIFYKERESNVVLKKSILFERYKDVSIDSSEPFIFHSSYYRLCKNPKAVNITTLHDFTYEYYKRNLFSSIHKLQKKKAVLHSDGVICISNNTLKDLYKYYPEYNGLATVIYHGYDSTVFKFKNSTRNKNIIFIGSREGYKNFSFAVNLLKELSSYRLLIIGGGPLSDKEKNNLEKSISNRYEKIDYVTNTNLSQLYNESFALLYPSSYEGFGLPVLESQACGCPVICRNISSIPEVSGDACIYVNTSNIDDSISSITNLFNYQYYKELQNRALKNITNFSWEETIRQTNDFYHEVYKDKEFI